tara:strand:+ start:1316 stop:3301 length:1986 start_codon:yes stop_codon:yes gene_type:complete
MPIRVSDVLRNQSNSYPLVRAEDNQVAGLGYFTSIQDRSNLPTPKRTSSFIAVMSLSSESFVCQFIGADPLDDGEWTNVRKWAKLANEKNVFELLIEDSVRRGSNLTTGVGTFTNNILGDFDQDGELTVDDFLTFLTGYVNTSSTSARTNNTSLQRLSGRIGSSGAHLATWEFNNYDGTDDFMLATTKAINEEIDTKITAAIGNFDFDTSQTFTSAKDNFVLTYDHASGLMKLEDIDTSRGIERVAGDSTKANVSFTSDNGMSIAASTNTGISLSESSPGDISFSVNADTDNNNPTSIAALTIAGQSAAAKATITFGSAATISGIVLNDLDNADVGNPSTGHFLKYDGSNWVGSAVSVAYSDVTGTPTLATVATTGSYNDLSDTPTIPTDTNLGGSDQTLSGQRVVEMGSNSLDFQSSSVSKFKIFNTGTVTATGRLTIDGNSVVGGAIRMKDADNSNIITLQAPTNLGSNVSFVLPDSDGTANQVIKTDGSGNLSFTDQGGSTFTQVYNLNFFDDLSTLKHYFPWKDINEQSQAYQDESSLLCPFDGRVRSVSLKFTSVTGSGDITIGIQTCPTGGSVFAPTSFTVEETEVLSATSVDDNHTFHFVFDNAQHFEAGDMLAISIQNSVDITGTSYVYATAVIDWDTSTDLGTSSTEHESNP